MAETQMHTVIAAAIKGRELLAHPFYQRWERGELSMAELGAYAEQYRYIEQALPGVLGTIATVMPEGDGRDLVAENLEDELHHPIAHVELFDSFAAAAGARPGTDVSPAMAALVGCYEQSAASGPVTGLAAIAAYEMQAADVAASKGDGLRRHYGLDEDATAFWDVHATLENAHATWTLEALAGLAADPETVFTAARQSADLWSAFLDEREAVAASV